MAGSKTSPHGGPEASASAAWSRLRAIGGFDLADRDADLEEELRGRLNPAAATLDEALRHSTTDNLVRILLDLSAPHVEMFNAVLRFFQAAGVRQGREQWEIRIEEDHLELEHLISFLRSWIEIDIDVELPEPDFDGIWEVLRIVRNASSAHDATVGAPVGAVVSEWLAAYREGNYPPLPEELAPGRFPEGLAELAGIVRFANGLVRTLWGNRDAWRQAYDSGALTRDQNDALGPGMVAQNETDFWLGSAVGLLGEVQRETPAAREALGEQLKAFFARFPRRRITGKADMAALERILSLPVWQRRHELYAVWIATEIVGALDGHSIELHHDNGKIVFAFRETVVATVLSTDPRRRLYAERRVPLANPVGKGRKAGVQPDYGIWAGAPGQDDCILIVEVKHYKRDARSRFREVVNDYARAHPEGVVLLVNHGPAADMLDGIDAAVAGRCRILGDLTPGNGEQRQAFARLVRDCVGEPVIESGLELAGPQTAILIDTSGSMAAILASREFEALFERLARNGAATVALVDTSLHIRCSPAEALAAVKACRKGGATYLDEPIEALLEEFPRILLLTDEDCLDEVRSHTDTLDRLDFGLIRAEIRRTGRKS